MITYKFGMKAEEVTSTDDFSVDKSTKDIDANPYGRDFFDTPANMSTAGEYRITSIPSPYARMHITDIAFREVNTGRGKMSEEDLRARVLSSDYRRAMSHCLDVFEMLFHYRELDLAEKGISLHQIELASTRNNDYKRKLSDNPNLRSYIETLDLFRASYLNVIRQRGYRDYKFDFKILYLFKYNGRTFAASSPFTGFFAKADADLTEANLTINGHRLFTATKEDYRDISERDLQFRTFMYVLLKDGLGRIFKNLYEAVKSTFSQSEITALSNQTFQGKYPEFNFGKDKLPKINTITGNQVYIRPDGLDTSYLKYLLFLEDPIKFKISKDVYDKKIEDRVFPDDSDQKMRWLCINDLLADSLVVLPYEIRSNSSKDKKEDNNEEDNDNKKDLYNAVCYLDENNNERRRCLIPIKREALDYLSLNDLIPNLKIKKYADNHFAVSLKIKLDTGGDTTLRRDYYTLSDKLCTYPNGILIAGEDTKRFAFGIYPFVKSKKFDNIYKVLFYNSFKFDYSLKFYYYDEDGKAQSYSNKNVKKNQTNSIKNLDFQTNCHYYQVHDGNTINGNKIHIEFIELEMTLIKPAGDGSPQQTFKTTSIIAPNLKTVAEVADETIIAVDLGTSNTYMAYYHKGDDIDDRPDFKTVTTMHDGWNELVFMNTTCTDPNARPENRDDLYLRQTDDTETVPSDVCLPAQLCEFIPTRIVADNATAGYKFPIPSVVNNLRIDCGQKELNQPPVSLVHYSIPFGYYTVGKRTNSETVHYDNFAEGTFKWFFTFDANQGFYQLNQREERNFKAFLEELLFIVRSHMLCKGYDLEKCKLIWTYPISFDPQLVTEYKKAWETIYCRFFNPRFIDSAGNLCSQIDDHTTNQQINLDSYVMSTNESRTPLFECCQNPIMLNHFTVLMDVGGGSTDIIGYHKPQGAIHAVPMFLTSFNFAGNALYLDGGDEINTRIPYNVIRKFMELANRATFTKQSPLKGMECINLKGNESLSAKMNYGFSSNPEQFGLLFKNPIPQFMLKLHNAALLYHTAQICHLCSPNEVPRELYLSGNGSRLFALNGSFDQMVKEVFKYVYGTSDVPNINIVRAKDPKAATAIGSLKGFIKGDLQVNNNATADQKILLGDEKTIYTIQNGDNGYTLEEEDIQHEDELRRRVYENVKNFISMFYEKFVQKANTPITKEEMLECLELVQNDNRLQIRNNCISKTFFFNHIALMMEQVSVKIWQKQNQKQPKDWPL